MPYKLERFSGRKTRELIREDYARLYQLLGRGHSEPPFLVWCHPSFVCVFLYRIANHFYRSGHRYVARFWWHLNMLLTGADISEPADLGGGLVVMAPAGTAIMGKAGKNLTVMACAGMGGEMGKLDDVGGGPGVPVVGDDVILEPHCGVLGPVVVGDRVRVCAGMGLSANTPDDTYVESASVRIIKRREVP